MGWHGQRRAWAIRKMDELDALNVTIERLSTNGLQIEDENIIF
jgi:hypothetical protein